ncbi:hypothetical protein GGI15_002853 [Coemansia interrupta]|uniref:SART-1 protein n=1 Tax=Coemansia interrupta TaxID=1126814 RepID=A0A9W8LKF8_9FUNG|nr:hypothetical protein GGI15_002853 [Coemansia interrupta]
MSSTSASEKQGAKRKKVVRPAGQAFDDDAGSDEDLDALRWIERTRRRQQMALEKAKATPRSKNQHSSLTKKYSADDLKGVRIAHNLTDFAALHATSEGGDEHVLVLQDKSISEMDQGDDEDGDNGDGGNIIELESVALAEADHMRSQKLKQAGATVTTDLDSEKAEGKAFFTIESGGIIDEAQVDQDERDLRRERGQIHVVIDDDGNLGPSSAVSGAYAEPEPAAAFRKPRKVKKSRKKDKTLSTNDFVEIVDADRVNSLLTRDNIVDSSQFAGDDDDLQAAISKVRKSEARKRRKVELDPEELARQITDEVQSTMDVDQQAPTEDSSDLVLSSTIEFVQALKNSKALTAVATDAPINPQPEAKDEGSDEDDTTIVRGARLHDGRKENGGGTAETALLPLSSSSRRGLAASSSDSKPTIDVLAIDQPEPTIGTGLGAALNLLRQRNMIDKLTDEQKKREQEQRSREQWIAEQRRKDAELQRELQRIKQMGRQPVVEAQPTKGRRGKADVLTQKELDEMKAREQELLDRKWARDYEERMKDYKPEVKLEYVDETGRQLSTKEAYKQLSHAFHGHYSGKNKVDRLNRQRERERKQLEHGSSVTTHEHAAALENAHRKMGTAGIDLSQIAKPKQQP